MDNERKEIKIAVIGPSMSGKSTFIASLLADSVRRDLLQLTDKNTAGQTKVSVHYTLDVTADDDFVLESLFFESLDARVHDTDICDFEVDLSGKVPDIKFADSYVSDDGRGLFVKIVSASLSASELFRKLVNDDAIHIKSKNITYVLRYVRVCCKPCTCYEKLLREQNYNLTMVDTRGLLDDNFDMFSIKATDVMFSLHERGIYSVDACMYFNKSGNSGLPDGILRVYDAMLKEIVKCKPLFVVEQSSFLTGRLPLGTKITHEYINAVINDPDNADSNFKCVPQVIQDVCKTCYDERVKTLNSITKEYGTYLLLSRFNPKNDTHMQRYQMTVEFAIQSVISVMQEFYEDLDSARSIITDGFFISVNQDELDTLSKGTRDALTKVCDDKDLHLRLSLDAYNGYNHTVGPRYGISDGDYYEYYSTRRALKLCYNIVGELIEKKLCNLDAKVKKSVSMYVNYMLHQVYSYPYSKYGTLASPGLFESDYRECRSHEDKNSYFIMLCCSRFFVLCKERFDNFIK